MDPVSLTVLAVVVLFALAVGLSLVWWIVKSAVRTMVKTVAFGVTSVFVLVVVGAGVTFFVAH